MTGRGQTRFTHQVHHPSIFLIKRFRSEDLLFLFLPAGFSFTRSSDTILKINRKVQTNLQMQTSTKSLLLKSGFIMAEAAMIHTSNWNKFYKKKKKNPKGCTRFGCIAQRQQKELKLFNFPNVFIFFCQSSQPRPLL